METRYSLTLQSDYDGISLFNFDNRKEAIAEAISIKRGGTLSYPLNTIHGYSVEVYDYKKQKTIYSKPVNKK